MCDEAADGLRRQCVCAPFAYYTFKLGVVEYIEYVAVLMLVIIQLSPAEAVEPSMLLFTILI